MFLMRKLDSEASKLLIRLVYLNFLKFIFKTQVTGVGVNTEWGLLMASVSEDNGGETPLQVSNNLLSVHIFLVFVAQYSYILCFLQVRLNGVATFIGIVGLTVAGVVLFVLVVRCVKNLFLTTKNHVE